MARKKKLVAVIHRKKKKLSNKKQKENNEDVVFLMRLVDVVRRSRKKEKSDVAFNKIIKILKPKIDQLVFKFNIPGHSKTDILQEALFALRYKAIKDYDKTRSSIKKISPFDKFAILCIRRHLATRLKASYQNKSRTLNSAASIDRDRGSSSKCEENLFLSDIIPQPNSDVVENIKKHERFSILINSLYQRLSQFEKQVLRLYGRKHSYNEIANIISNKSKKRQVAVKSVDNALSRIKNKAKNIIEKFGNDF